jgi:peptide/nickel transport system permease protein
MTFPRWSGSNRASGLDARTSFICDTILFGMTSASTWTTVTALGRHNALAAAGLVLVTVFVVFALFAPWIAQQDPANIDLPSRLQPPSAAHWFGTDELGRDIFSRAIYGARISMLVGASVVAGSLLLGLIVGSIAGYYGGFADKFFSVVLMNAFLSFPGILLAIAFVAFLGPGIFNLILALCIGGWVGYARLVRAQVLAVKEKEFVEAARALGASDWRIVTRHILPNIIQPVIVQAAIGMAGAVLAEATMSFLGLGVPPPTASWGSMLNDARAHLFDAPHMVLFPAAAVMLAVLSFNFIGDALRDYMDPRSRIEAGL